MLTVAHLHASCRKVKISGGEVANLLFVAPGVSKGDEEHIARMCHQEWAYGLNVHIVSVRQLSESVFALLDESWRVDFLKMVGQELDRRQNSQARKGW